MPQYEMNLRDYWFIIRRRRVVIATSTILVALFSFWFAQQKVPVYQATAGVRYEQSAALSGVLIEVLALPSSSADSIETQVALIKSTPILEEVARVLGRLPEKTAGEPLRETKAYWATLDGISGKAKVSRVPSTSILEITVTSTDPREAKDLANTVAQVYKRYSHERRNARITEARKFIEGQVKEIEARVKRAEEDLWAFRDANRVISPGAESTVLLSMYQQIRGDLEKTRQQRFELDLVQARLVQTDSAASTPISIETTNTIVQRLQQARNELILERNTLAVEMTDRHPRIQALDDRIREIGAEIRRQVGAQIAALRTREEILSRQLGEVLQKNQDVPTIELGLQRRQRDLKTNDDLLTLLKTKYQDALIKESEAVEEVTIVRPAAEPDFPTGTEKLSTVMIGALLGLMLGTVLAFVQENLDTSIGTIEDVESYLEVPVLGVIPHIDARETQQRLIERRPELAEMEPDALRSHALLITHFDPKSPVAEAYRTLRTNIQFARLERAGKVLVVTSPTLQEGKTTTIVNLALTMAQSGQRALLLGSNLRRPHIYRIFGIEREPGLSDILVGSAQWRDCVRTVADILMGRFEMEDIMASPGLDNLHIIESGPIPPNPSELLSTRAMTEFLRNVRNEYDIVLVDTPPVLPVTDAAIVGSQVDGVVLVYQAGKVGRMVLKRAKVHLESVGAKVWGVVLNDVHTEIAGYQYTHYYTHYYGEETPTAAPEGRFERLWMTVRDTVSRTATSSAPSPSGTEPSSAAVVSSAPEETVDEGSTTGVERQGRRWPFRGSRRFWLAVVLSAGLLAALGGVIGGRAGWFGPERPVTPLREKIGALLNRPEPASPAAPTRPREPAPRPTSGVTAMPTPPERPAAAAVEEPLGSSRARALERSPGVVAATRADRPEAALAEPKIRGEKPPEPSSPRPPAPRFAVEFGPFPTAAEAERTERKLNEAGYPTVRFRQQSDAAVYGVLIERLPTAREAQALVMTLREQGFSDPVVLGASEPLTVRVGEPLPLRGAVQLAERLRVQGYQVRVAAEPGEAVTFVIRHGNFTSREEVEARGQELMRLGLANQAVQVK